MNATLNSILADLDSIGLDELNKRAAMLTRVDRKYALDAATAYSVSAAILAIEGLTRIVVTHRLEEPLLRKYDEILVLKNGEICERGSFDALMARREQFYSLFNVANG